MVAPLRHRGEVVASRTQELEAFVREALLRGLARPDVEQAMLQAGWTTDQARDAMGAFAEVPFPVAVPRPRPSLSAAEAFEYLLLFMTLYLQLSYTKVTDAGLAHIVKISPLTVTPGSLSEGMKESRSYVRVYASRSSTRPPRMM